MSFLSPLSARFGAAETSADECLLEARYLSAFIPYLSAARYYLVRHHVLSNAQKKAGS